MVALKDGVTYGEAWYELYVADQSLTSLLKNDLTPLVTCRSAAVKLQNAIRAVVPDIQALLQNADEMAKPIGVPFLWGIRGAATDFETVFAAELETTDTYYVSQKGIYSTNDLIERAEHAFTPDVQAELSPQAISDIRQAGKCLAFDLDTASGFHIMRATETLIHRYYVTITGTTPRRKDRNWGAYVRNLNAHNNRTTGAKADVKLISLIDQIREHHRNPIMHPEITLTPDEAQSLFSICQAAIISFAGALRALGGAVQMPLQVVGGTAVAP